MLVASTDPVEARNERRLLRSQVRLVAYRLLIFGNLDFALLSKTGAGFLVEVFNQRYERGSILVISNLPFAE